MRPVRIALAQLDMVLGNFEKNKEKILSAIEEANTRKADIVAFPELAICGYPPEDLLLQLDFTERCRKTLMEITERSSEYPIIILLGYPERKDDTYNSCAVIYQGKLCHSYQKIFLPNYGVFDEKRYFSPGTVIPVYETQDYRFGVGICEDIWQPEGPIIVQAFSGDCELVININASPYHRGKREYREKMVATRASDNCLPIAFLNLAGGQDELVFDGQSFVCSPEGEILARAGAFSEEILYVDLDLDEVMRCRLQDPRRRDFKYRRLEACYNNAEVIRIPASLRKKEGSRIESNLATPLVDQNEVWEALVCGVRDYVEKNGFRSVIIGLSGGIDSALVATIATDALGSDRVYTVFLPSRFTSDKSYRSAKKLAQNLGVHFDVIEIERLFRAYLDELEPHFKGKPFDVTEENLQARIRGNILMALSNKFGHLVLSTGNKSEMSVGYATLYGDMVGGFAVLKDVPKTLVWELARWRNREASRELIPKEIIERPPTAELRENQKDTDTLPPYDVLDQILSLYIEKEESVEEVAARTGFDIDLVARVARMVDRAEYKRRQAPPGIKITHRAFGKERRMPITRG